MAEPAMHVADYNVVRYAMYATLFTDLLRNEHNERIAINLLMDVRHPEVARAFVVALTRWCNEGPARPLSADVGAILGRCATCAFGTSEHRCLPSWFLQNYEGFLASSAHKLLRHYSARAAPSHITHRAFDALLQVAEGMRKFVGLETVRSGAHALLLACHHSRCNFLAMESASVCAPHLAFMEVLANAILREPERSVNDRHNSLAVFAKSERWQQLSRACAPWLSQASELSRLNAEIGREIARAEQGSADIATLASAFLATSPPRVRRVVDLRTPTKPVFAHRVIHKRSVPFVKLVRKLVQ